MSHSEKKSVPTPHIEADQNAFAKTVLMPGDPLRAQFIAETFLEDIQRINDVRGMLGFTGNYKGEKVSVMGSGMGMPSIGIYSYELFKFYGIETIIRVGSCGAYAKDLNVYDVLLADSAYSNSSYAFVQNGNQEKFMYPSKKVNEKILEVANAIKIPIVTKSIHSSDVFYMEQENATANLQKMNDLDIGAVEMESFALFSNAQVLGKQAACILTVSDSFVTGHVTTAEERQNAFTNMMKISLETAIQL
ncbi:MAG: purine-nucleoside phosphorylase [Clostridiales bacterium]|nr:purine-nucleoside phosphorylase [Clostridiales bacterium]